MLNIKRVGAIVLLSSSASAFAVPFSEIRIGDQDGFGYDADANFANLQGDGGLVDRNGNGRLEFGEVLPSLNGNQVVANGNGDEFDNRLNETINGTGFTDNGTSGVEFTDISLTRSYDRRSNRGRVYNANTSTRGVGGAFPAGNSTELPNQPGFVFDFSVAAADIVAGTDIFFNMVFGDYDVRPAEIDFIFAGGMQSLGVTPQNNGPDNGLIQAAFAELDFADVFTFDALNNEWDGLLTVNFDAPREPYTAFDFVELSVTPIAADVSEPGGVALLLAGLAGLGFVRRRRAK